MKKIMFFFVIAVSLILPKLALTADEKPTCNCTLSFKGLGMACDIAGENKKVEIPGKMDFNSMMSSLSKTAPTKCESFSLIQGRASEFLPAEEKWDMKTVEDCTTLGVAGKNVITGGGTFIATITCFLSGVSAENGGGGGETKIDIPSAAELNQLGTEELPILVGRVIKTIMGVIGSLALVSMVFAGFLWMTSMGNAERRQKAATIIVWTSLAIVVLLSSYSLASFLFESFN